MIRTPVDPDDVARVALGAAGAALRRRVPALDGYSAYAALQPSDARFAEIARRLATSWATSGRRCAVGALDACAAVLTPFDPSTALALHLDATDHRTLVALAQLPSLSDSVFFADRRACLAGDDAACGRAAPKVRPGDPFNDEVRGSLLTHAIELGGRESVARLLRDPSRDPLTLLTNASGVPRDSLLRSWHRRTRAALDAERSEVDAPVFLASGTWIVLLLAASARRRYL